MTNHDTITKATAALAESVRSIVDLDNDKAAALAETFEQFQDYMTKMAGDQRFSQMFSTPQAAQRALACVLAARQRFGKSMSYGKSMTKEQLEAARVAKLQSLNAVAVAKVLVADNDAHNISETELVDLVGNYDRQEGESVAKCFARHYEAPTEDGAAIRKAIEIVKAAEAARYFDIEPVLVSDETDVDDPAEAIRQLQEIGRDKWPTESEAKQFERAFTDPANAELAAKAHRRPSATTVYPMPARR